MFYMIIATLHTSIMTYDQVYTLKVICQCFIQPSIIIRVQLNHDLWRAEFMSDNLLDYCTLIENATEIHVSDSAFSCLMPFLDLKNVKRKCVYTCLDLVSYHTEFKNWEILARQ